MDELINSIVVIPSQCDHHMYTSNTYDFICPLYFSKAGNKFIVEFINWHNDGRSNFPLINEWHSTYMAGYTFAWVPLPLHKLSCLIIPSVVGVRGCGLSLTVHPFNSWKILFPHPTSRLNFHPRNESVCYSKRIREKENKVINLLRWPQLWQISYFFIFLNKLSLIWFPTQKSLWGKPLQ